MFWAYRWKKSPFDLSNRALYRHVSHVFYTPSGAAFLAHLGIDMPDIIIGFHKQVSTLIPTKEAWVQLYNFCAT